jgi:FtsP/CotA-like multicopper oxidase with cupredoxin domain
VPVTRISPHRAAECPLEDMVCPRNRRIRAHTKGAELLGKGENSPVSTTTDYPEFQPEHSAPPRRGSRRGFLQQASVTAATALLPGPVQAFMAAQTTPQPPPDYTIEIADLEWELAPKKKIRATGYNGQIPGKLLRLTEGKPVTIDIQNRLNRPEIVHWHGQWIPSDVDGSMEEGSPMIPPGGRTRIEFTPRPTGLHWYHTHTAANRDLSRGVYSGQFGILLVEPRDHPGNYDQEQFLVLHEWEPYFAASDDGSQEVAYRYASINGRMLGHGDPIQVRPGQRVLFHILNASATLAHSLALPGHSFQVLALDGRPVPTQAMVDTLRLGPAERITALVAMDHPGIWILGETDPGLRNAGMGTVVEYTGASGESKSGGPRWLQPASLAWDYRAFGAPRADIRPDITIPLVFTSKFEGHGALNRWMINGKSFPEPLPLAFKRGLRHRLVFDNRSMDDHPVHLHRHAFELVSIAGAPTGGVLKDVVIVKAGTTVEADLVPDNPGDTLFHCHQQDHMDLGFMALFHYA